MPNYLANRCFNSTSEMSAFAVDSTDEDGLGPFVVPVDATSYKVFVWRKTSTATVDSETVYTANGPGRWIALSLDPVDSPIIQFVDVDALKAYTTPTQGYLYSINTTPPSLYSWDTDSTATESGTDIIKLTALATGRMYKIYPVPDTQNIVLVADLAGLKALSSASQVKLYYLNSTPPILYSWDAESTTTDDDDLIVKLTALATGRMYKIYPVSVPPSGSTTIVSSNAPSTVLEEGTIYIWDEDSSGSYSADVDGRYPDSRISYVSNGTVWLVTGANKIFYAGDPTTVGKPPNSVQEEWVDTSVSPSVRYGATISSSSVLSWEAI